MPSSNVMNIIVKAEDMASSVAQKVENSFRKLGNTIDSTFTTSLSNTKFNQELTSFGTDLDSKREAEQWYNVFFEEWFLISSTSLLLPIPGSPTMQTKFS